MMTGYLRSRAIANASFSSSTMPSLPGVTGTPTAFIVSRAMGLSPIAVIDAASGPMNLIWQLLQISANRAFSARNP